jgi:signal transduction histidine kinase/CheY-like chemotaxis protein
LTTISAAVALLSSTCACYVAALSLRFSRAPGWRDQRWFALVACSVAAYSALNVPASVRVGDAVVVHCSRLQLVCAALHAVAWLRYSAVRLRIPAVRAERWVIPTAAAAALLGVAAAYPGGVNHRPFAPLGITYNEPVVTPIGNVVIALVLGLHLVPCWRFAAAARRGIPYARLHLVALSFLLLMGVNDALAQAHVLATPYLVDVGFIVPVAAVGYALTSRFVEDAREHARLRVDLEQEVALRTAELRAAQGALHEKLTSLAQVAAGVAHEVNNPASVVAANLQFLSELPAAAIAGPARSAVQESIVAMERLSGVVRQLLDTGRTAADAARRRTVRLRPLAEEAVRMAQARCGSRVRITNAVSDELTAAAQDGVLAQVLANLVVNGAQAIPEGRDGGVVLRGEEVDGGVRVTVEDDGVGMSPDILQRVFDPFFTTKPFGNGTGLGLSVSRGLVVSLGGDLRLESTPGRGTRATVELPRGAAPPSRPQEPPRCPAPVAPRRIRVLLVDDDPMVRVALSRQLEARYDVRTACGVEEALSLVRGDAFDLVLCDLMMPDGGGERLYEMLRADAPAMARQVVFVTGGAVNDEARRFLDEQPQPVLYKPFQLEELVEVAERVLPQLAELSSFET